MDLSNLRSSSRFLATHLFEVVLGFLLVSVNKGVLVKMQDYTCFMNETIWIIQIN